MNYEIQYYKKIPLMLIKRNYANAKAKRFTINGTNQNVWIPNKHLDEHGNIRCNQNIDYVLLKNHNQCKIAGIDLQDYL